MNNAITGLRRMLVLTLVAAGCTGNIGDSGGKPGEETSSTSGAATEAPLHRLTSWELDRTLARLLGDAVYTDVKTALEAFPGDAVGGFSNDVSDDAMRSLFDIALAAGTAIADSTERRTTLLAPCASTTPLDRACFQSMLDNFGLRVFRRPLDEEESDRHWAGYQSLSDEGIDQPLASSIASMMLSPSFVYHVESRGVRSEDGGGQEVVALTSYEIASRLAYSIEGSMPDAELFAAADVGELDDMAGIVEQARRLVRTPWGEQRVLQFYNHWLELRATPATSDNEVFLDGIDPVGLQDESVAEVERFISYIMFEQDGTYADLLTSPATFPATAALAEIYGVDVSPDGDARMASDRGGLLEHAAFLRSYGERTSIIYRGVRVRRQLLCDDLPDPDPEQLLAAEAEEGLPPEEFSNRDIIEDKTNRPACNACHARINPVGFLFERFDALGRIRTEERVFDLEGNLIATHPIKTEAVPSIEAGDNAVVADSAGFRNIVAKSDKARACFARKVYEFTRLREAGPEDEFYLNELSTKLTSDEGTLLDVFIFNVANSGSLRRLVKE